MTLTKITTHVADATARLIEQFKRKPRLEGLVASFAEQAQKNEDVLFGLLENRGLDGAVGAQLDGLGEIVGQPRNGKSDADYLLTLKARILLNVASGTADENLSILSILTSSPVEWIERYPAAWDLVVADRLFEDPVVLASLLSRAGGVKGILEYTVEEAERTFTFADGDDADVDAARGFAEELQVNGSFDDWIGGDPDGWTVVGESPPVREVSEVGPNEGHGGSGTGAANLFTTGMPVSLLQAVSTVAGETYVLSFDLAVRVGGVLRVLGENGSLFTQLFTTEGSHVIEFAAADGSTEIMFATLLPTDITIDNVAVHGVGGAWADAVAVEA